MALVKLAGFLLLLTLPALCLGTDSLKFLVLGDWGGLPTFPFHTSIERGVAKQMGRVKQQFGGEFVLALGDNFYFDGVKDVSDKRFKETYDYVFTADSLKNVPWYLVAGNHDHNGNVSAQIEYSKHESRWNFKDFYYLLQFPVPGGKNVDIVMIDTVLLCGNSDHDFKNQQPVGPENQHLEITRPGLKVNFFVIGAANFADTSNKHKDDVPTGSSKFFWANEKDAGGFAKVELTSTNMTLTFVEGVGKELYQQVLYPRH
ncbi:hypothetical protein KUTeg_016001 [Tegillarca granosa]|uniref:Calcineurin-like phosphoesterase domain-containing protein n=1 Tax=Tegillarca granosa TaxID=220873 RepID=A0ABQ9ENH6_TEGGR|nr:hypothetical protein KUTeg_016001 [Tegillarca granosa]